MINYIIFIICCTASLWLAKKLLFREKTAAEKRLFSAKALTLKNGDYCYSHDTYDINVYMNIRSGPSIVCSKLPKELSNIFIHCKDDSLFLYTSNSNSMIKIYISQTIFRDGIMKDVKSKHKLSPTSVNNEEFLSLDVKIENEKMISEIMEL